MEGFCPSRAIIARESAGPIAVTEVGIGKRRRLTEFGRPAGLLTGIPRVAVAEWFWFYSTGPIVLYERAAHRHAECSQSVA
jgi:hypothetical protein